MLKPLRRTAVSQICAAGAAVVAGPSSPRSAPQAFAISHAANAKPLSERPIRESLDELTTLFLFPLLDPVRLNNRPPLWTTVLTAGYRMFVACCLCWPSCRPPANQIDPA